MQANKKHISGKTAVIFIGIMLFFTLFSRTIYYIMTPKVTFDTVESGYIKETFSYYTDEFYMAYDSSEEVMVPYNLEDPLEIISISVKEGDKAAAGDELIAFDAAPLEESIAELRVQLGSTEVQLKEFNKNYTEKICQLEKSIEDCKSQIAMIDLEIEAGIAAYSEAMKKKNDLGYSLETAENELKYIKNTGILNGQTVSFYHDKIKSIREEINNIEALIDDYSKITSKVSGTISEINYKQYDKYPGIKPLITIIPDNAPASLVLKTNKDAVKLLNEGAVCTIRKDNSVMETESMEASVSGEEYLIYVKTKDTAASIENAGGFSIEFETKGEFCNLIVPNPAFYTRGKVYVLLETSGFWGKEYYVESREVEVGRYNHIESSILKGIDRRSLVVTGWDRELKDGQRVMLPLN